MPKLAGKFPSTCDRLAASFLNLDWLRNRSSYWLSQKTAWSRVHNNQKLIVLFLPNKIIYPLFPFRDCIWQYSLRGLIEANTRDWILPPQIYLQIFINHLKTFFLFLCKAKKTAAASEHFLSRVVSFRKRNVCRSLIYSENFYIHSTNSIIFKRHLTFIKQQTREILSRDRIQTSLTIYRCKISRERKKSTL